jgi:hypothetical protein
MYYLTANGIEILQIAMAGITQYVPFVGYLVGGAYIPVAVGITYSWNGDPDTGLAHDAADTTDMYTGNSVRQAWDNSSSTFKIPVYAYATAPVGSDLEFTTKWYVDHVVNAGNFNFYFATATSDLGATRGFQSVPSATSTVGSITVSGGTTVDVRVATFTTIASYPNTTALTDGLYSIHLHAVDSNAAQASYRVYCKLYTGSTTLTLQGTSELSDVLSSAISEFDLHLSLPQTAIDVNDRILVEVWTRFVSGAPTNNVTIYVGGTYFSHISAPVSSTFVEANYAKVTGSNVIPTTFLSYLYPIAASLTAALDPAGRNGSTTQDFSTKKLTVASSTYIQVRLSGNQSIPDSTWKEINFDTEDRDSCAEMSGATFTVVVAGEYEVTLFPGFDTNATGQRLSSIFIDGTIHSYYAGIPSLGASLVSVPQYKATFNFSAGQKISAGVWQNSTGALNVRSDSTIMTIKRVH